MLVAVCADKGSPGVTTTCLTLTAVWPRPAVMVELDPSGGDVALTARLESGGPVAPAPSLLGLATAVRSGDIAPGLVGQYAQRIAGGISVVPGLTSEGQSVGMATLWPPLVDACLTAEVDVLADLGRISAGSAVMPIVAAADVLLLVVTPTVPGVVHLRGRVAQLFAGFARTPRRQPVVVPVVVTTEKHAAADVREIDQVMRATHPGIGPAMFFAEDPKAVARLLAGEAAGGRLSRSALIRSARVVAEQAAAPVWAEVAV